MAMGAGGEAGGGGVDAKYAMMMLSTRVYLNVNHDFELEPEVMLGGAPAKARKRSVGAAHHASTAGGELGFAPLEVFDLFQRTLHPVLGWLDRNADQASDVMEATVRLLSGREGGTLDGKARLQTRAWQSMEGLAAAAAQPAAAAADGEAGAAAGSGGGVARPAGQRRRRRGGGRRAGRRLHRVAAGQGPAGGRHRDQRAARRPRQVAPYAAARAGRRDARRP